MKPTPEQVAEKYETHYDPAGGPHWVTREAATGQYVAYHYIQEAADRLTTKLNALGAAEADGARLAEALQTIASYDRDSHHGEGLCPYGCDTPAIARDALAAHTAPLRELAEIADALPEVEQK